MKMTTFEAFPKIPRLMRDVVVTEKLDGTNASIEFIPFTTETAGDVEEHIADACTIIVGSGTNGVGPNENILVKAGSKNRWLRTDVPDNYGFRFWVTENAAALFQVLGFGRHFGEWWGAGIQRRYGLESKRFSLFNVDRFKDAPLGLVPGLGLVPVLYQGMFDTAKIDNALEALRLGGSVAAPGFYQPEGLIVYHTHARSLFKYTLDKNDAHKDVTYTDVAPECTK